MEPLSLWEVMEGMGILEVIGWGGLKSAGSVQTGEFGYF